MTARGQGKAAEQLRRYAEGMGDAMGEVVRSAATGIPATKEVAAANIFLNDAVRENVEAIKNGKQGFDAVADTARAAKDGVATFSDQVSFAGDIFGGVYTQASDLAKIYERQQEYLAKGMSVQDALEKAQQDQMTASGKTTEEFVGAQLATADASKNLQSLGFSLATAAIPAVNKFATALDNVTGYINKNFGVGGTKVTPAGVDRGPAGGPRGANTSLSSSVAAAMKEYHDRTGKNARITSEVRSREEQQRLYDAWIARGRTGNPVAKPGTSKHETGNAIDINEAAANEMDRMGILQKYGLVRPYANDPVHVELAGPSGRYKSTTADVKPPTTAGEDTKQMAEKTSDQQSDLFGFNALSKQLAILNQTTRDQLIVQKKILAKTA
jgi:D-alanyl-D-alanine carboxypeptidase